MIGSSIGVGSSDEVSLNSGSRPTKGGRLGHGFRNKIKTCAIP
jgi:hypothetical protein